MLRPVRSKSLARPAREWHDAVYLRALPRQRLRHAESSSSRLHVAQRPAHQQRRTHRWGIDAGLHNPVLDLPDVIQYMPRQATDEVTGEPTFPPAWPLFSDFTMRRGYQGFQNGLPGCLLG